ncbi:DUF2189 domain-containing protein [Thauera sp. SDU_THAU2]|uniref:DUF2189 domain-containing protein n=1 Tax=Thauera sp. SDU_THAU2 TaxID=3136633 RepID=UPI00311D74E4
MTSTPLKPAAVRLSDISAAMSTGWRQFCAMPALSTGYAAVFVVLGAILFWALESMSIAPISLSFAGGFMLIGPALLAGFFALSDSLRAGRRPVAADIGRGFARMPRGGWVVSFVCALLFLIWITDAGTLYGFMVGREPAQLAHLLQGDAAIHRFVFFSSIMGAVLAFILFAVSAFSIPLIYDHRANLVSGVVASVRAVFGRFGVVMAWACLLAAVIIVSAVLLPLLLVTLPVMAYASRELYFRVYPVDGAPA